MVVENHIPIRALRCLYYCGHPPFLLTIGGVLGFGFFSLDRPIVWVGAYQDGDVIENSQFFLLIAAFVHVKFRDKL